MNMLKAHLLNLLRVLKNHTKNLWNRTQWKNNSNQNIIFVLLLLKLGEIAVKNFGRVGGTGKGWANSWNLDKLDKTITISGIFFLFNFLVRDSGNTVPFVHIVQNRILFYDSRHIDEKNPVLKPGGWLSLALWSSWEPVSVGRLAIARNINLPGMGRYRRK